MKKILGLLTLVAVCLIATPVTASVGVNTTDDVVLVDSYGTYDVVVADVVTPVVYSLVATDITPLVTVPLATVKVVDIGGEYITNDYDVGYRNDNINYNYKVNLDNDYNLPLLVPLE